MTSPPPHRPPPKAQRLTHGTPVTTCDSLIPGRVTMSYQAPPAGRYYRVQFPPRMFWSEWWAIYRANEVSPIIDPIPLTNKQIINQMRPKIPGAKT